MRSVVIIIAIISACKPGPGAFELADTADTGVELADTAEEERRPLPQKYPYFRSGTRQGAIPDVPYPPPRDWGGAP
jgi:hypothetical protein